MTVDELLELQSALVTCLTDPRALKDFRAGAAVWKRLLFVDPDLLELMSSLYQGKRLDKLTRVLPKTLAYLASEMADLTREFMKHHPPLNADSYTNACQFYGFLRRRWRTRPPNPPFLPDLAYCELARVGLERQAVLGRPAVMPSASPLGGRSLMIRRSQRIRLYVSQYDIQSLFDTRGYDGAAIVRQPMFIVLSRPLDSLTGRIFSIDRELFVLLRGLNDWTMVSLADEPHNSEQTIAFLSRLERLGFLEASLCGSE
jgi:hypothetical protein